ncbi:alanine racemase [Texcoconibacillus texcoconensis]|uniref:Alanine racemase n=1 Tax=Texcoconibacillus texcoconensis TaxID=1095777 RepID=A0A840QS75_9BACI|nr:alanine racemase [Texcoconibacillus texcoconensis]MBB5174215.1 alanine racemase [Texcoconibacillus texcoconensis]
MGERQPFYRDTWVEVNLDEVEKNIHNFQSWLPDETQMMAVVKANGYGHGAEHVARVALRLGVPYIGVATLDEALALRKTGVTAPVLVLGYIRPQDTKLAAEYSIALTVFQADWLDQASKVIEDDDLINCHLKIDTGMARIGIRTEKEGHAVVKRIRDSKNFQLEGVYTHFATADELDASYADEQKNRFDRMLRWLKKEHPEPIKYIHAGNSATALRHLDKVYNMVRVGISMYGLTPADEIAEHLPFELHEAFSLHSRLVHVKKLSAGEAISYGATYQAQKDEWIGTVPIGYADGWIRENATQGEVLVNGVRCPIVGRICMDQMMVLLPHRVEVGEKVTLIGRQQEDMISVAEVARRLGTITYEIPCMISYRVPRAVWKGGKMVQIDNDVF